MTREDRETQARPALFPALFDDDPESTTEPRQNSKTQLKRMKEAVRHDLEELLNTRQRCLELPRELRELERSVFDYGVPDVTGADLASPSAREAFLQSLSVAIARHDPRLKNIRIQPLDNTDHLDRTLRFRIEATLRVAAGREAAVFDFQLEPVSRHFDRGNTR
jgi:type VI secretion system protein ImpF